MIAACSLMTLADTQTLTTQPAADTSTIHGAIDAFTEAAENKDPVAMAAFFYVQNAKDNRLALANAKRILCATAFEATVNGRITQFGGRDLAKNFGLINDDLDYPKNYQVQEHGDTAVGTTSGPDEQADWFKKIDGVWKQDITPPAPYTASERAQDMEEDNAAIQRIIDDVNHGKYKTLSQVRDALGQSMLNAAPDPMFMRDMRLDSEPQPRMHPRIEPKGPAPVNPTTPAGAMNRFVHAMQSADIATLQDSFYLPQDKDNACHAAEAHHAVAGLHLLQAAETKFTSEDSNRICFWVGVHQRYDLRDYTEDEWIISPDYPDLALDSAAEITATVLVNGQNITTNVVGYAPAMHRGSDGVWRLGPRFPQNARQTKARAIELTAKNAILEQTAADIRAGKYSTTDALMQELMPKLQRLGGPPNASGLPE
jgi:hypothetical protein